MRHESVRHGAILYMPLLLRQLTSLFSTDYNQFLALVCDLATTFESLVFLADSLGSSLAQV